MTRIYESNIARCWFQDGWRSVVSRMTFFIAVDEEWEVLSRCEDCRVFGMDLGSSCSVLPRSREIVKRSTLFSFVVRIYESKIRVVQL